MRKHSYCANKFAISIGIIPFSFFLLFPSNPYSATPQARQKSGESKKLPSSRRARQRARLGIYQEHQESPSLFDELSSLEIHFARDCRMARVNGHRQPGEKGARGIRGGFRCA